MNAAANVRAFGSAHRYFQGPGALAMTGELAASLGREPLLICDAIVHGLLFPVASRSCAEHDLPLRWGEVRGDVTRRAVRVLVDEARADGRHVDLVIAAGGGKGVDTGKAVARELGARLLVLPTSASNDGPCSKSFVFYDDQHRMESVEQMPRNPDVVLVDTELLVKAPRALLVSGIGDALCKLYEGAQTRLAGGRNLFGGLNTIAAEQISVACDRVIRADSVAALGALDTGRPSAAFERLTEALVLLSGIAFENSGLSLAHSITRGLPLIAPITQTLHGFHVGYGLLVQFLLENRSDAFMAEQFAFYRAVGLAVNLRGLNAPDASAETIRVIADGTMASPHLKHFERPLTAADFVAAMTRLEHLTHLTEDLH
ncbi:glycerol dehydrogenase [Paraburkholderia sp. BCC1886]|uniref:glycerol dehydrogenase n=1 Tax=Paraburkholderia sp. BCC1886 TaxID=2562670 RepID=UPI0011846031|nr:glycerol dehydrogenase [Paraburkholderia sp. BCC1886]